MEFKLVLKKLNNKLTSKEDIIFDKWYSESQMHKDYYDRVKTHFYDDGFNIDVIKGWESLEKRMVESQRKDYYWKYAVAASVIIILGITLFYFITNISSPQSKVVNNDLKAGTDKAVLTLEDGTIITLEEGKPYQTNDLSSDGESIVYKKDNTISQDIVYNYLAIPRGGQFLLILSDDTKIWLNSDSKIKYPKEFEDGITRKVELIYGEAYFDVSPSFNHNGSKFQVLTKRQEIEVLGTEFNIKAYNDETSIYTTLVEGKVTVNNGYTKKILKPTQQSIVGVDYKEFSIIQVDTYDITSWRRGIFSFKDTSLFEITKVLSRWYDVQFIYENEELKSIKYNGVLDKNHSIETILSILKTTNNINYEIKNKTISLK